MFTASFIELTPAAYTRSIKDSALRERILHSFSVKQGDVGLKRGCLYLAWPSGNGATCILPIPLKDVMDWKATAGAILVIAKYFTIQIGRPQMNLWQYYRSHKNVSLKQYLKMEFGLVPYPDYATPFVRRLEKIIPQSTLSSPEFISKIKILEGDKS